MFKKSNYPEVQNKISSSGKKAETIIGPAIKVKGNFNGKGNTIIEGELEGSLKTDADVFVGSNANILANIKAKTAKIGGKIVGDIKIDEHLDIMSSANLSGNIECKTLSIESGAVINGQFKMTPEGEAEKKTSKEQGLKNNSTKKNGSEK